MIRVSKSNCFALFTPHDWLKTRATFYPITSKTKTIWLVRMHFPALCVSYMQLIRVLIGSLYCLCSLWLARVFTLVLVLRHSIKNCSILKEWLLSPPPTPPLTLQLWLITTLLTPPLILQLWLITPTLTLPLSLQLWLITPPLTPPLSLQVWLISPPLTPPLSLQLLPITPPPIIPLNAQRWKLHHHLLHLLLYNYG